MRFHHVTLADGDTSTQVAVVVDVLRAFTTAAYAFDRGAKAIWCVGTVTEAFDLRKRLPGSLAMGEVGGLPVDGFDLSNSPAEMLEADVAGRVLVQRTSAGTQGLIVNGAAEHLLAASFVCAGATARAVGRLGVDEVTFVATGVDDRDGDEDRACADYLEALLSGRRPDPAPYLERVHGSDAARTFRSPGDPDFPPEDLAAATRLDAVGVALVASREDGQIVLRAG